MKLTEKDVPDIQYIPECLSVRGILTLKVLRLDSLEDLFNEELCSQNESTVRPLKMRGNRECRSLMI